MGMEAAWNACPSESGAQRDRHLAAGLRRLVDAKDQLERLASGPTISVGAGFAPQHLEDVAVVAFVAEPVDVGWGRARRLDELVVVVVLREQPVLDPVHGGAADLHRAALSEKIGRASCRERG